MANLIRSAKQAVTGKQTSCWIQHHHSTPKSHQFLRPRPWPYRPLDPKLTLSTARSHHFRSFLQGGRIAFRILDSHPVQMPDKEGIVMIWLRSVLGSPQAFAELGTNPLHALRHSFYHLRRRQQVCKKKKRALPLFTSTP